MAVVQGICFDLFNTLLNVANVPASQGRFTADILGVNRQDWNTVCFGPLHDIIRPVRHFDTLRVLTHSLDPAIAHALIEEATNERQGRFDFALQQIDPPVLEFLASLRKVGIKLALVSNASSAEIQAWHRSPLADLFDTVVFSCDCGFRKPEAGIYQLALDRLGLLAQNCLFIGDGGSQEHHGAYQVGLRPVLITHHLDDETIRRHRIAYGQVLHAELAQLNEIWGILRRVS